MSRKKDKGRSIRGPFVPLLKDTLASPAWRQMEPSSRLIYIALKGRYGIEQRNNGRLYLSVRMAAKEVGISTNTAMRGFHELIHYGFIVMIERGSLGVDGKGKAPHWRLTELGYMTDPPTNDFQRWDGTAFRYQKKQKPVATTETGCLLSTTYQCLNHCDIQTTKPVSVSTTYLDLTTWGPSRRTRSRLGVCQHYTMAFLTSYCVQRTRSCNSRPILG